MWYSSFFLIRFIFALFFEIVYLSDVFSWPRYFDFDHQFGHLQARSHVSRFGGAQCIFRGARFLLLLYV